MLAYHNENSIVYWGKKCYKRRTTIIIYRWTDQTIQKSYFFPKFYYNVNSSRYGNKTYQKTPQSSGFWSLWFLLKVSPTVQYAEKEATYVSLYNKNKKEFEPATLTSVPSNISPSLIWLYVSMNSASEIETWNLCGYGFSSVCFSCATAWLRNLKYSCTEQKTDNHNHSLHCSIAGLGFKLNFITR